MTVPYDESARAAGHWERSAEQSAVGGSLSDLNIKFNEQLRLEETPTDTGNAFRFARLLGDRLRYSTAEEHWLVWDGTRLRRDDGGEAFDLGREVCEEVRRHAAEVPEDQRDEWRRWAKTSESHARREAMLRVAATLPSVRVRGEDLDARPLLLNAPNGTVDLSTLEVRPPSIADLQTRCLSVPFDPAVRTSPLLEDYVATFVPEPEYWHYLTQVLGSSLRGGNDFRLWLIMHGPSTTGKTQLVETIHKILGDYMTPVNTSVFRANMDDRPRPDLMRVLPARLAYAEEGSSSWELHGDHLKRMTGGDPLVARGMRSNVMVERVPAFTPMIVCNDLPRVRGADPALRRRLRTLEFRHSVAGRELVNKREEFMSDRLTLQALLTQLVLGCRRAYTRGLGDVPAAWLESAADAFDELNHVAGFLSYMRDEGRLVEAESYSATQCWRAQDLHLAYRGYISMHGNSEDRRTELNMKEFAQALRHMGWHPLPGGGGAARWAGRLNAAMTPYDGA